MPTTGYPLDGSLEVLSRWIPEGHRRNEEPHFLTKLNSITSVGCGGKGMGDEGAAERGVY